MKIEGVIYVLFDIRTDEVRYVGKTLIVPSVRLGQHRRDVTGNYKARWIRSIGPEYIGLRVVDRAPKERLSELERAWIAKLGALGVRLTNLTKGGEGGPGAKFGAENPMKRPEIVAKVQAYPRRRDALWRARISASKMGQKQSAASIEKMAAFQRGRPKSAAHKAAVSEAQKRRNARMTPEQRSAVVAKRYLWMTPEMRSEIARKGHETRRLKAANA